MNNRRWTKEEEEIVLNSWGTIKVSTIAKRVNRSEDAVRKKASRLNLGTQMQWYGVLEVAEILGMSKRSVLEHIMQGKLKASRDRTKKKRYVMTEEHIKRFMRDYQDLWDTRRVTINLFDNIPKWLTEKEEADKNRSIKKHISWSDTEVKILIDRFRRGYPLLDISKELDRSKSAIKNKLVAIDYGRSYKGVI